MSSKSEMKHGRVSDIIVSWECKTGTSESTVDLNVPFTFGAAEVLRISYAKDSKELGFSGLYSSDLFGTSDPIGTFSDSLAATDSGYKMRFQAPSQKKGKCIFRWNNPGTFIDRTGVIYVHLRFYENGEDCC